ncbi:hypothetical protein [Candidatus Sulfurimonas baltica]|uniref:Uncharacterized protein n=1 Tax=Candidatus Sulfurimonas baltica TaxID=2740404 RepID=A0A7S7LVL0_9BACT|nr:hypothetical protein [Candidatus Sulfurimonas baltica]QOY52253.1 hypothetical protein HUE88_00710 [Candidatus Sulfurimonas baltica]
MPITKLLDDNCKKRIKPTLLRDVKTEALLVFSRTALERYFEQIDEAGYKPSVGTEEDTIYVYETLRKLLANLQECVVNVDYAINLVQGAKKYPELRSLAKLEEPLINYYDVMAEKVSKYYADKPAYLPECLVICLLGDWILEEEKSVSLYPFLKEIDFLDLIGKFESNRKSFEKNDECKISEVHELSFKIIEKLKNKKYKVNKARVSKTRKK